MRSKPVALPRLSVLGETLAVCRLDAGAELPAWASAAPFYSVTRTADELSVVCRENFLPGDVKCEPGWRAFEVEGPLDFSVVGVLAGILTPLAEVEIPVFTISTHDTDYVLVKEEKLDLAAAELREQGFEIS